jgi:hypothetical protein
MLEWGECQTEQPRHVQQIKLQLLPRLASIPAGIRSMSSGSIGALLDRKLA